MDIIKDLETGKQQRLKEADSFVDSCKLLLESNQTEERRVLDAIGLNAHLVEADKNIELRILNQRYTDEYEGKIFHRDEIRDIAMNYRLFMRKSFYYRGQIPPDLGAVVLRLVKKVNIPLSPSAVYNCFYVLAPPRMFSGYKSMPFKAREVFVDLKKQTQEFLKNQTDPDPLLFFQIDADHFLLVKKWGNDINWFRRIPAFFTRTPLRISTLGLVCYLSYVAGVIICINNVVDAKPTLHGITLVLGGVLSAIFFALMYIAWLHNGDGSSAKDASTSESWYRIN